MAKHYYYLHENGKLIHKSAAAVDALGPFDYFDSPFVLEWWAVDTSNRADAWNLVLEAAQRGADAQQLIELQEKWGLNEKDARVFTERTGIKVKKSSGVWSRE